MVTARMKLSDDCYKDYNYHMTFKGEKITIPFGTFEYSAKDINSALEVIDSGELEEITIKKSK